MKQTLLEMTQDILSSMDSDEVNSITDTVESYQVATLIKTTYNDLVARSRLPEHWTVFNLDPSGDSTKPVLMTIPETIGYMAWVKYNTETTSDTNDNFVQMKYVPFKDFIDTMHRLPEDGDNIETFDHEVNGSTVKFVYTNDLAPSCYTTFDDDTLIFDSYDFSVDTTLQSSKTMCYGRLIPTWEMSDAFYPDLDESQFSLLFNEAKALAWAELKQTQHAKAEIAARRGWVREQTTRTKTEGVAWRDTNAPNYGRK